MAKVAPVHEAALRKYVKHFYKEVLLINKTVAVFKSSAIDINIYIFVPTHRNKCVNI